MSSGDVGYFDEGGLLYVSGRDDERPDERWQVIVHQPDRLADAFSFQSIIDTRQLQVGTDGGNYLSFRGHIRFP